jgi:hypothetical protein
MLPFAGGGRATQGASKLDTATDSFYLAFRIGLLQRHILTLP